MKYVSVMAALILVFGIWLAIPTESQAQGQGIVVTATAYTCDNHPNNPMYPCGPLRWGGKINSPGMACPASWRGRYYEVPGYGTLKCDDTGAYDYWNGRPHIDIRVSSWEHAYNFGVRRMTIYPTSSPRATAPVQDPASASPQPVTTPSTALDLAEELAPQGDSDTAMVRLLAMQTIQKHLPFLANDLDLGEGDLAWIVTLWQPNSALSDDAKVDSDLEGAIAAQLFVLDPETGEVLAEPFVTLNELKTIGWLSSDQQQYTPD